MNTRLHVGNLPVDATREEVATIFRQDGREVLRVDLVMSRRPERSRGFAFVEMATQEQAEAATLALDGREMRGRTMRVSTAFPPKSRYGGFSGLAGKPRVPSGADVPSEAP